MKLTKRQMDCLQFLRCYEYISTTELKKAGYKYHITQPLLYAGLVDRTKADPPLPGEVRERGRQLYYWWVTAEGIKQLVYNTLETGLAAPGSRG